LTISSDRNAQYKAFCSGNVLNHPQKGSNPPKVHLQSVKYIIIFGFFCKNTNLKKIQVNNATLSQYTQNPMKKHLA